MKYIFAKSCIIRIYFADIFRDIFGNRNRNRNRHRNRHRNRNSKFEFEFEIRNIT